MEAVHAWTKAKRLLIEALRIIPMSTSSASGLVSGDCVFIVSLPLGHSLEESVANTREEVKHSFHTKKTKLGYTTFFCPHCLWTFNERTGTPFNSLEFPTDI